METSNKIGEAGSTNYGKRNHSPSPSHTEPQPKDGIVPNMARFVIDKSVFGWNKIILVWGKITAPLNHDRVVAAATVILAFLAFLQWQTFEGQRTALDNTDRATRDLAKAALKQADAAIIVQQPYVIVSIPKVVEGPFFNKLEYSWTNYGLTPAILRLSKAVAYISDKVIGDAYFNGWDVLRPNESRPKTLETFTAKPNFMESRPLFWIEIMYFDIFNNMHVSSYTYLFATHDGASGEFVAIPGGEKYNYHHVVEQPADGKWNYKFDTPPDHQP